MKLTNKLIPNSVSDARYNAAVADLQSRHSEEYEDVHNGSGRSEEFPSDLARRHSEERTQLRKDRDVLSVMEWIGTYGSWAHRATPV